MQGYRVTTRGPGAIYGGYIIESHTAAAALAFAQTHLKAGHELLAVCAVGTADEMPKTVKVRITEERTTIQVEPLHFIRVERRAGE